MDIQTVEARANHYLGAARKPGQLSPYDQFYYCMADTGLVLSDKAMREIFEIAETVLLHKQTMRENSYRPLIEIRERVHELITGDIGMDDFTSARQMGVWFETGEFIREEI